MSEPRFVSFKKEQEKFIAYVPVNQFLSSDKDIQIALERAADLYEMFLAMMQAALTDINNYRNNHKLLPAKVVWRLGNIIFEFVESLNKNKLQIDGIYQHLERDLNVKRKWLEKVIILRRYIPDEKSIPESASWGYFEKGTRRKAAELMKGIT